MKTNKQIGVYLDHSDALISTISKSGITTTTRIVSEFNHQVKEFTLSKNENLMHNKEQHEQAGYYHKIIKELIGYNEILLFGPTDAKNELANLMEKDQHFSTSKIETKSSDKLND